MERLKTNKELERKLKNIELLEAIYYLVERSETTSKKHSALARFTREARSHIDEQRDVILISIKVK